MNFNDRILWAQKLSDDTIGKSCTLFSKAKGPQLGRENFHSVSRNNSNLHFKFTILIRQNKWNHLLFYARSFIQFCARKFLLSIVVFKMILVYQAFSKKFYTHEMFGPREFRSIPRAAPKSFCGPLL